MPKTYTAHVVYENGDRDTYEGLTKAAALRRYNGFKRVANLGVFGSSGPIKSFGWSLEA